MNILPNNVSFLITNCPLIFNLQVEFAESPQIRDFQNTLCPPFPL